MVDILRARNESIQLFFDGDVDGLITAYSEFGSWAGPLGVRVLLANRTGVDRGDVRVLSV
jgi:hypothetical protein